MQDNAAPFASPSPVQAGPVHAPQELWRSINFFNLYRIGLAGLLVALSGVFGDALTLMQKERSLFLYAAAVYLILALLLQILVVLRKPRFSLQLALQVGVDIVCVTVLAHVSGGIQSSLGILLLVSLAAAGMISRGRVTLFFAALASIAVLLQHSYAVLTQDAAAGQYLQAGLLSAAYFVVAWTAHRLAKYAVASENLAAVRGVDLVNMAEANRLLVLDMPDGVLVVNERGMLRQCNPSAERLLGFEFKGGNVTLDECSPPLAQLFTAWRAHAVDDPQLLRLPVTHHLVRVRFLPVQREGYWGAVVFLEDMQRIQAQAQQIKLAALGRLTANIAHEVRNPLSSISYAVELLQEGKQDTQQSRLLQIILDNSGRVNRIIKDVMQLNQRDRAQSESLILSQMLPSSIMGLSQSQHLAQEVFAVEVPQDCVVDFDRSHLERVIWNLCGNALRYCSKQAGSVRLRAQCAEDMLTVLEVSDDGPGVSTESAQKLFEPFFTTSSGGAGLGLYIARELCEANGARLEHVPQAAGGACFRIIFGARDEH